MPDSKAHAFDKPSILGARGTAWSQTRTAVSVIRRGAPEAPETAAYGEAWQAAGGA
jgi:hypothetical protein